MKAAKKSAKTVNASRKTKFIRTVEDVGRRLKEQTSTLAPATVVKTSRMAKARNSFAKFLRKVARKVAA